jgi:hypothetical protein
LEKKFFICCRVFFAATQLQAQEINIEDNFSRFIEMPEEEKVQHAKEQIQGLKETH